MFHKKLFIFIYVIVSVFFVEGAKCADISFTPKITIRGEYNDNVLFSRNNILEDFITQISPEFSINADSEQTKIALNSRIISESFVDNSELNTLKTNNDLSVQRIWNAQNISLFKVSFTKDSTLETELQKAGIVAIRSDRYRYELDLSHTYIFNNRFSVSLESRAWKRHYPDNIYPDMNLWNLNLNPMLTLSPKDTLGLFVSFYYADYENDTVIKTFTNNLYWSRQWDNSLKMTLGSGYRITWNEFYEVRYLYIIDPTLGQILVLPLKNKKEDKDTGILFRFDIEKKWTERFSTKITASREQYYTTTATSTVLNYILTSFNYKLNETMTTRLNFKYSHTKEEISNGDISNYIIVSPVLNWMLGKHFSLNFGGDYEYVDQERPKYNKHRFKCYISLRYSWPRMFATH